jgi:hypothetical protein
MVGGGKIGKMTFGSSLRRATMTNPKTVAKNRKTKRMITMYKLSKPATATTAGAITVRLV